MEIDLVVPFVDNNDKVWQKVFMDYCYRHQDYKRMADMRSQRFQDNINLIEYTLRLVEKNMPWVRTIHLLLSNREQAPKHLPSKVKVVLHAQFIPYKYLPTFNSTTIEMFLHNIPNLSEHFIYINDDMLPTQKLEPSDFFTSDGKIKMSFTNEQMELDDNLFRHQCINSYKHIEFLVNKAITSGYSYLKPLHTFTPMIKSHNMQVVNALGDTIFKQIRAFRTQEQHNQYIYPIYEHFVSNCVPSNIKFYYSHMNESNFDYLKENQIVCINRFHNDNRKVRQLALELEKLCQE